MYQVFDNDKPADYHHYKVDSTWSNSKFSSFEEAVKYARAWGSPFCGSYDGSTGVDFQLNQPYDYSGHGDTITIKEV